MRGGPAGPPRIVSGLGKSPSHSFLWAFIWVERQQSALKAGWQTVSNLAPGLLNGCIEAIDIDNAVVAVLMESCPGGCEVRLPQELRFADERRSNFGDIPLARNSARAPKSSGCNFVRCFSRLLCSLRLASAAVLFRSNL